MSNLNNSPSLTINEIIPQLFNNELLSDVKFSFNCDKVINAHSLLLMSRSVIFEKDFDTNQGVKKLIPVLKYDYNSFSEFIRFIYTDKCNISSENVVELLELSFKYKVPKLENEVIAFVLETQLTASMKLQIYQFCIIENYQILHDWTSKAIGLIIQDILSLEHLQTIQPATMESILKMDFIGSSSAPIKEVDLFKALIEWMQHYCTNNGIPLSERNVKFDNLLRLIRFPIMSVGEFIECINISEKLFTDSQYLSFVKSETNERTNCVERQSTEAKPEPFKEDCPKCWEIDCFCNHNKPIKAVCHYCSQINCICYDGYPYTSVEILPAQFKVTEKLIISGLKFMSNKMDITSIELFESKNPTHILKMPVKQSSSFEVIVSLGNSILLQPGSIYNLKIPHKPTYGKTFKSNLSNIVQEEFINSYNELNRDPRLIGIIFKMPGF